MMNMKLLKPDFRTDGFRRLLLRHCLVRIRDTLARHVRMKRHRPQFQRNIRAELAASPDRLQRPDARNKGLGP